jgi:hypothetical protein
MDEERRWMVDEERRWMVDEERMVDARFCQPPSADVLSTLTSFIETALS